MQPAFAALVAALIVANGCGDCGRLRRLGVLTGRTDGLLPQGEPRLPDGEAGRVCCARSEQNQQPVTTVAASNDLSTPAVPPQMVAPYGADYLRSIGRGQIVRALTAPPPSADPPSPVRPS